MSREELFARQICHVLDRGTEQLDHGIAERLRAARERALQRPSIALTCPAAIVNADGTALLGDNEGWHPLRSLLLILAIVLGMAASYYWNGFQQVDQNETVDSALLAGDLPPKAYLDPGFQAWLSHYAQSAR